jgi:uncharacterized protein YbcI
MTSQDPYPNGGSLNATITKGVVAVYRKHIGRGPTKARTFLNESLINVLLEDTMTTAERQLIDQGEQDFVLDLRRKFQLTMRDDLVSAVEKASRRKVLAFMSDSTLDPDMALESFVVE